MVRITVNEEPSYQMQTRREARKAMVGNGCARSYRAGAAMTEAVVVICVLCTLLIVTFQMYRMHVVSMNASIVGRSLLIMRAYSQNFSRSAKSWTLTDLAMHQKRFVDLGFFPGSQSVEIDQPEWNAGDSAFGAFAAFVRTATDSESIRVRANLPALPFTAGDSKTRMHVCGYGAVCAVDSWNWTDGLFGKLYDWITESGEVAGSTLDSDIDRSK